MTGRGERREPVVRCSDFCIDKGSQKTSLYSFSAGILTVRSEPLRMRLGSSTIIPNLLQFVPLWCVCKKQSACAILPE